MSTNFRFIYVMVFLMIILSYAYADDNTCLVCHSAMNYRVKTPKGEIYLGIDEARYRDSVHGFLTCNTCHKLYTENPHIPLQKDVVPELSGIVNSMKSKAKVDPVALASCSECHGEVYKSYLGSVHGENIMKKNKSDGPSCIDCHGSAHYIVPKNNTSSHVNKWNLVQVCGGCHDSEEIAKRYGYGLHIVEKYNESFHGKKYRLGHEDAPTCVDCHGYHDVRHWNDPLSPVAMKNRTVTCGKCHRGATEKFVTAITHKPVGKDNPIPYYAEKVLIILTISVFAFITVHVILETYSEIRDRIFRK